MKAAAASMLRPTDGWCLGEERRLAQAREFWIRPANQHRLRWNSCWEIFAASPLARQNVLGEVGSLGGAGGHGVAGLSFASL